MTDRTAVVLAKSAAYQVVAGDSGALFTNRGASASVTFTLPASTGLQAGWQVEFYTVVAQPIVVASSPVDTLTVHADATADTLTTAGTIGQHIRVIFDGTGFLVISDPSAASAATAVTAVTLAS